MANNYFRFKKFTVHQDKAAMKVGTDGVLLGAWVDVEGVQNVLDVGTGTGLIALMIAQRHAMAKVTAIDIEKDAYAQAQKNFDQSVWNNRLKAFHTSLQSFNQIKSNLYDLIVCNPPFFENSFKSGCFQRNLARHTDSLSMEDLVVYAKQVSSINGRLAVILPETSAEEFIDIASKYSYNLVRTLYVKPNEKKNVKRRLIELQLNFKGEIKKNEICIETTARHFYSNEYKDLTKDFYLAF